MKRKKDQRDENANINMMDDIIAMKLADFAQQASGSEEELNAAKAIRELLEGSATVKDVNEKKKDMTQRRWTERVLGVLGIVVPAALTAGGLWAGFQFESCDEVYTSPTFKMFMQNPYRFFRKP